MIGNPDALLHFGTCDLKTETEFPSVINLDKTTAGGTFVGLHVKEACAGGSGLAVTVEGSADGVNFAPVSSVAFTLEELDGTKELSVGIPHENKSRYLKLTVDKTGSFSAGTLEAFIDTYARR